MRKGLRVVFANHCSPGSDPAQAFPIRDALRHELSWPHYGRLIQVESETAREWYMNDSASQNWSSRALDRQINTLYYERLLLSQDKAEVFEEAASNIARN